VRTDQLTDYRRKDGVGPDGVHTSLQSRHRADQGATLTANQLGIHAEDTGPGTLARSSLERLYPLSCARQRLRVGPRHLQGRRWLWSRRLSLLASKSIGQGCQGATLVSVGGGIRSHQVAAENILDGYMEEEMCPSARGQSLIPWPNRLGDGSYSFAGRSEQLALSQPENPKAIHGLVRFANWSVAEQSAHHAVLAYRLHPQPGYPHLVDIRTAYTLADRGLTMQTTGTNRGPESCPIGLGAHPYVRLGPGPLDSLRLCCPARECYRTDDHGISARRQAVNNTAHDFRRPRRIGPTQLDTAFTSLGRGADGRMTVALSTEDGSRRGSRSGLIDPMAM
jgi:aldose 1-epimerase